MYANKRHIVQNSIPLNILCYFGSLKTCLIQNKSTVLNKPLLFNFDNFTNMSTVVRKKCLSFRR